MTFESRRSRMKHRLVASIAATLVLALAAFTGTSLAGNGQGNGGKRDQSSQEAESPATTSSTTSSTQTQSQSTSQGHHGKGSGSKQSDTSPSAPATGGDNSHGVKPSNSTKHDTYAKASSDKTKQYGNGKTAGQIATKSGHGNEPLHGPGNSQPHKTAACPGGHDVDVHALKNKGSKCGSSSKSEDHS